MRQENIDTAISIAQDFLLKAQALKDEKAKFTEYEGLKYYNSAPKQSGALRRASMDLTRALAEMRLR